VDVLSVLDADAIRRWSASAARLLRAHQPEIDALNVYPVADRDTGTNMARTMAAAAEALAAEPGEAVPSAGAALAALARGAVLSARGNSGMILSQILHGMASAALDCDVADAAVVGAGLRAGSDRAWAAVGRPVEGTILTVARAAADAATSGASLAELVTACTDAAAEAVARTPDQLEVLARAGVVDAGGRGLLVVLAALSETVTGVPVPITAAVPAGGQGRSIREAGSDEFGYEVQYLLDAAATSVTALRERLAELGDSVLVVDAGGPADGSAANRTWNVHAHVNDVGAAIEAGMLAGRPHRIAVSQLADGGAEHAPVAQPVQPLLESTAESPLESAVVAVAPGEGMGHLFEAEGVAVVDGVRPTAEDVLTAIRATGSGAVVLLPNSSRISGVAEQAAQRARDSGMRATVVPTRSPVQGLAAVAVHDPSRRFDDDVVAMAEAAAATRFAEITVAEQDALTAAGMCHAGDVLGLIDGEVVEIGRGLVAVVFGVIDRLIGVGAELMTVLVGADAPPGLGDLIMQHVRQRSPLTEVSVYPGGQPRYPVIIGVE
jgi:fatty acid kinase